MKVCTVHEGGDTVAAVERSGALFVLADESGAPYRDVREFLQRSTDWDGTASRASRRLSPELALSRPVVSPGAVVCVGLNYRNHILEMKRELPTVPTLFSKLPRALTDPDARIPLPAASPAVDYEGELVIVIGKGGRNIPKERAWEAVFGLTLMNDVSMRDWQRRSLQWFAGKSWQSSTPVGPVVVTPDELPDLGERELVTKVNGEVRQRAALNDLVFDVPTLVADLSVIAHLEPGDLIATGTPGGVGDAMKPPAYLAAGDLVEVSVDGIGTLRCTFERAT